MEFIIEYDIQIEYIKGKENNVVDALSRKKHLISTISSYKFELKERVLGYQLRDPFCITQKKRIQQGLKEGFEIQDEKILYFIKRLMIPLEGNIRNQIMYEDHTTPFSTHPSVKKMK